MFVKLFWTALAMMIAASAHARECSLGKAAFVPIDKPDIFTMAASGNGYGYVFALRNAKTSQTIRFTGTFQSGTGFVFLNETGKTEDEEAISTQTVLFREDLTLADPWGSRPDPVAYAFFDNLSLAMMDRARFQGFDATDDRAPPKGLWKVVECRP
jgi:hypothetical protein